MQVNIEVLIGWEQAYREALQTIGKEWSGKTPTDTWKKRILLAEHSPIRAVEYRIEWVDVPSWVVTHFVRHHVGITHYVKTQRTDRTGVDRDNLPQGNLISYSMRLNAQSMINISRRRLCSNASKETREIWEITIEKLKEVDAILASVCVPECIYRGFCSDLKCCGRIFKSEQQIKNYRLVL
jgi:thymidylate synthase ThyX